MRVKITLPLFETDQIMIKRMVIILAKLMQAKSEVEVRRLGVANLRDAYINLANDYNRLVDRDVLLCPSCGDWLKAETSFYFDKKYATNRYPICKRCLLQMVEQRKNDKDEPNETKESVQKVLQMMDRVYDDTFYNECVKGALDEAKERNRNSPFATYITAIQSLPNWKGKTWADSDFGDSDYSINEEEVKVNQKTLKNAKKRFGSGYSTDEYMLLENEYQDWVQRYECNTKAQEEVFENLSVIKLLKKKALLKGESTRDLDKQQQDWLDTGKLKPKQNSTDTMSDAQTFGTLLQKWEETRPLPEVDEELKDVDKIGLYFDVFFRGHASKMLGLKNTFSHIYESFMKRFTVGKPEYDEDEDSEIVFEKVFGASIDE